MEEDAKSLAEISRVLKAGGKANILVHGQGGLINRICMELLRDEYRANMGFQKLVDDELTPEWLADNINWLIARIDDDGTKAYQNSLQFLESPRDLIDDDFVITFRDRMQPQKYNMYTEKEFS